MPMATIPGDKHRSRFPGSERAASTRGVHGDPPSAACLRVSTAARAKALGFPAGDRATAVRMRDWLKYILVELGI